MPGNDPTVAANAIPVWIAGAPGSAVTPLGYQQITGMAAATNLTPPAGATSAVIQASTQAVRYRDDGVAPTATVGQPLAINQQFTYSGPLTVIQFIQQTSGAILDVTYYK